MNVLYVGNVGPRSHASYCTENHVAASLTALGHSVHPVMEGQRCDREVMALLRSQPIDLVLYTRTDGLNWDHQAAIACWDEARSRGIPTASIHLDVFFGLDRRGVKVTKDNALFAVDAAFTADGDHQAEFAERGINHHWLPPGVLYEGCYLGTPREEYLGNVAFVGSSLRYHAEHPRRGELVRALEGRYPDLVRGGDGVTVRDDDLNSLYASTKCSAGDSLSPLREDSRYWSDRIPEATGRGSVLVHPYIEAAYDQFGDHVVWCGWDVADQIAAIEDVLDWPEEMRAEHRREAVAFVRENHSYRNRVQTLLDVVFG